MKAPVPSPAGSVAAAARRRRRMLHPDPASEPAAPAGGFSGRTGACDGHTEIAHLDSRPACSQDARSLHSRSKRRVRKSAKCCHLVKRGHASWQRARFNAVDGDAAVRRPDQHARQNVPALGRRHHFRWNLILRRHDSLQVNIIIEGNYTTRWFWQFHIDNTTFATSPGTMYGMAICAQNTNA